MLPPAIPLAHDPVRQLVAPVVARLDPGAFWGRGFDVNNVRPELTLDEIAEFYGPAYETTAPDQHTERVQYFDHILRHRRLRIPVVGGTFTLEVVRASVPGEAVAVIETIATWLRVAAQDSEGSNVIYELYDGAVLPPAIAVGTPFPWPLSHPNNQGGELTVEWLLVRERVPDIAPQPAFLPLTPGQSRIPRDTALTVPWRDQRYNWNGQHAVDHYFVTGDRSFLRLFATIIVTGEGDWTIDIAGRLGGFFQLTGYKRAGLKAALTRT